LLISLSCTSSVVDADYVTPNDAHKFENLIKFECKDSLRLVQGTGSCQYPEDTKVKLQIKVPPTYGQIYARSCQTERALDFHSYQSFVGLDWYLGGIKDSCPVIISVAGANTGINLFKWTPYVYNETYPEMALSIKYWSFQKGEFKQAAGTFSVQFPAGTNFYSFVKLNPELSGKLLVVSNGCKILRPESTEKERVVTKGMVSRVFAGAITNEVQKLVSFGKGTEEIEIRATRDEKGFCPISAVVKYEDNSIVELEGYIDWFDNKYVPLSVPRIYFKKRSVVRSCAPFGYKYFEANGSRYTSRRSCREKKVYGDRAYAIGWSSIGRMSYIERFRGD
jgi:hypothetical protein